MLRHSKSAVSMTFVCSGIAKLDCQISLSISFLSLICPCKICLKEKYEKKNQKQKDKKNALKMIASVHSRRCGSYRMYFEGYSPHQVVTIVCELKWFSHISNHHNMYPLMQSCDVFHTTRNILCYSWFMCKYNMIWPSQGFRCVNVCSLNCLNLVFEIYNWLDLFSVCVCVFEIHVLKILIERWFWEIIVLIGSLVELHGGLHSCLCFSLSKNWF